MCTAISYRNNSHYFGRNLDVDFSFNEKVVITPRNFHIDLTWKNEYTTKYALIGIAAVMKDYPLYYEASNEMGLCMAGLNFPQSAVYGKPVLGKDNIALYEIIPWILGQSKDTGEAIALIEKLNLTDDMYLGKIPSTPLHFMISDKNRSYVFEPLKEGIKIYENPFNVLTNNPPFEYHKWNMQNYLNLSNSNGENKFSKEYPLKNYGVGMGSIGLPGDTSSSSRFVRAAFNLTNSYSDGSEEGNVSQFFHVLDSVAMPKGSTMTSSGKSEYTLYSCCINADDGIFYYKTYENNQINAVSIKNVDLNSSNLFIYDLINKQNINYQN